MTDTPIRYTPETGYRRAQELIAECIATKSTTLDLGNLALEEVPEELGECVWLERLNLGDFFYQDEKSDSWVRGQGDESEESLNKFSDLPEFTGVLVHLHTLSLSSTQVSDLSALSGLTALTDLNLSFTQVSDLSALSGLTALTDLNLSFTQVSDLSGLSGLTALTNLNLSFTQVSDLSALSGLTALTNLNLSGTQVSDLSALSGLTALTNLNLWRTQVSDLSALSGLTALTNLDLSFTQVSDLSALSGLTALTNLDLSGTQVSDLSALSGLTALTNLNLYKTQVSDLSALSGLTALTNLDLSFTQVSDLSALSGLTALTNLYLSSTQVSDLSGLSGLTALTNLYLSSTQVSDLSALSGLTALTNLYLSSTQVSDLSALSGLTALTNLDLSFTQVSDLSALSGLTALTNLNLSGTQVSDLSGLSGLTALTDLNLSFTQVSDLSALSGLTALTNLDLSGTQVSDLSALSGLTALRQLNLGFNPQLNYPPEIFQSEYTSYHNLVAWEADKAKGTHPNNLFKLIICGNGTVGKTKIAKRIETGKYQEEGDSTEGVQIYLTEEKPFVEGYKKVRLAIWDFAGQEIYYQLHRLFFRSRAVYLVVFDKASWDERFQDDPKTGLQDENRAIDYWLSDIAASAGDAQIILVQNKVDEDGPIDISARLPEKFKGLPLVRTSAKCGQRFNELLSAIHEAIERLPRSDMELPQSWWAVREAILEMQQDEEDSRQMITKEEFMVICEEKELCANSEDALLDYLDGSGVVLYDRELFPEQIVIDQQWALDAIYTVLERVVEPGAKDWYRRAVMGFQKECAGENGLFVAKELPFRDGYSEEERKLFLKIMVRAGICFETNAKRGDEDLYLMFQYLREKRPLSVATTWSAKSQDGCRAVRYVFPYHLHKGIFRELVRELFPKVSLQHIWQEGLLLPWRNALALVSVNYQDQDSYLEIKCAGARHEAEHLLSAFRNLMNKQLVQAGDHTLRVSNDETDWFTYEAIHTADDGDAKTARTVADKKSEDWRELRWCLRTDDKADFKDVPEERHQEQVEMVDTNSSNFKLLRDSVAETDNLLNLLAELEPLVAEKDQKMFIIVKAKAREFYEDRILDHKSNEEMSTRLSSLQVRVLDLITMVENG